MFSPDLLNQQRAALQSVAQGTMPTPLAECHLPGNPAWHSLGEKAIREGRVATTILAGGQATRLGTGQPKALFSMSGDPTTTLLGLLLRKVRGECAVMVSAEGEEAIRAWCTDHCAAIPHFFVQNSLPLLNQEGEWFFQASGQLAMGPDGNGGVFHALARAGLLDQWRDAGIEWITVIPIDNPLANPFDPDWIGCHIATGADCCLYAVERRPDERNAGVIGKVDGAVRIVEYTSVDPKSWSLYRWVHTGMVSFSLSCAQRIAAAPEDSIPFHAACKQYRGVGGEPQMCWKCERFLFDWLPWANTVEVLTGPRDKIFAPLKTREGSCGIESVKAALAQKSSL